MSTYGMIFVLVRIGPIEKINVGLYSGSFRPIFVGRSTGSKFQIMVDKTVVYRFEKYEDDAPEAD